MSFFESLVLLDVSRRLGTWEKREKFEKKVKFVLKKWGGGFEGFSSVFCRKTPETPKNPLKITFLELFSFF